MMSDRSGHSEILQRMIDRITEKQEILKDLLRFTVQQKELLALEEVDLDAFTVLLQERGSLMERADAVDESFMEAFLELKATLGIDSLDQLAGGQLPPGQVQSLQKSVAGVQHLVQAIQQVDTENREVMKKYMGSLKSEITRVQQGKKAIHGYANTRQPQPSLFMDEKEKDHRGNRKK